ncbi:MAG: alcohol dehydrogenase catalytic domain-containing protein [Planctomycetaceae bacterium]|nr:alcohol dehydrogenase catalytic domain-containing protein [Planctomycetaceae bacterium]
MRALVLEQGQVQIWEDCPAPQPEKHEVLVKVLKAGVCETDLQLARGYMNFSGILGHEFVGVAESGRYAGQRVVADINCCAAEPCQACPQNRHHCARRSVLGIFNHHGAFAEFVAVPEDNLTPVPDCVSDDQAVFVEPLAAAFEILEQVAIKPEHRVAVVGDGRLGYLIAQVCHMKCPEVTVIGKHSEKLQRFTQHQIKTQLLQDFSGQLEFDVTIDCTGSVGGLELSLRITRPRGRVVLKTTVASRYEIDLSPIVINELQVIGSRCGPMPRALAALADSRIEVESLITARVPLEQAGQAIQLASQPGHSKVLIEIA